MSAHRLWIESGASGRAIDFDHPPVHNDKNYNVQGSQGELYQKGLHPDAEQRARVHCLQLFPQPRQQVRRNGGASLYQIRRLPDDVLGYVEYGQHNIEGICQDHHSHKGFENPLEKHPCVDVVQVVSVYEHLDQFIGHDEGEHQPGYR